MTILKRAALAVASAALVAATGGIAAAPAFASGGQPNQSCEDQPSRPGQAESAPGSAFDPAGTAGTHYAGQQPQNSTNAHSVSQYDVACAQVSSH
ncbi:hypothetical protein AV521_11760 [Streptomyces sp. IMTB 2501]|uniref:hypothetical protein n=1 Tax=Streptomyces sp. IMTB 2501 TaxID=1776340 RepID=UPI00096C3614|nr:hypothetical protein [Streptomyces sp. IMTB 2501]OLZ71591.1 hypothetical protein AV521_11760 [Streptomyces sp. IMTB 2501]